MIKNSLKALRITKLVALAAFLLGSITESHSQLRTSENLLGQRNVITTSVPFLTITPDARAGGMGDAGVATSPDANSIHWNPGKLAFVENDGGISLATNPWLKKLVPDVWLYYLSGYKKVGDKNNAAVAASLRYFTLGEIQFTDKDGNPAGSDEPKEFSVDLTYSQKLSKNLSLGIAMRMIYSRLITKGVYNGIDIRPGLAGAGDIGAYWTDETKISGKDYKYAIGLSLTNMGSKITYTNDANRDFIPINLRLGTHWETDIDDYNRIGISVDFNKLLVPTPQPVYQTVFDNATQDSIEVIKTWVTADDPVVAGMISSFGDAPGGIKEELREFTTSIGMEYWYDNQFAIRAGYFHEHELKGGRNYLTMGAGIRYNVFGLDVAYLKPFRQRHPLENTLRFTLLFDLAAFTAQ
jgi:hypothetical protein